MITSCNEWHEDTQLELTVEAVKAAKRPEVYTQGYEVEIYGFGLLEVYRGSYMKYRKQWINFCFNSLVPKVSTTLFLFACCAQFPISTLWYYIYATIYRISLLQ